MALFVVMVMTVAAFGAAFGAMAASEACFRKSFELFSSKHGESP
jgi:hypothetical protein